jgi:hypothetical protein
MRFVISYAIRLATAAVKTEYRRQDRARLAVAARAVQVRPARLAPLRDCRIQRLDHIRLGHHLVDCPKMSVRPDMAATRLPSYTCPVLIDLAIFAFRADLQGKLSNPFLDIAKRCAQASRKE